MFPKSKIKKQRILFLLAYILIACFIVLLTKPLYIYSILIVLVPPALVNFYWLKKSRNTSEKVMTSISMMRSTRSVTFYGI